MDRAAEPGLDLTLEEVRPPDEGQDVGMASTRERAPSALRRDALLVVLTAASGATDALSFLGLGQVFTAVMTGNLVLLGIALGRGSLGQAGRAAVAVAAFAIGVAVSSRVATSRDNTAPGDPTWPSHVVLALGIEAILELGLLVGWMATGGRPGGSLEVLLVADSAIAMGIQSGAVRALGVPGLSTTYLTGTLTWIVSHLTGGERPRDVAPQALSIAGMLAGAVVTAALIGWARQFAVLVPAGLVALVPVFVVAGRARRTGTSRANPSGGEITET